MTIRTRILILGIVTVLLIALPVSAQTTITYSAWGNEQELAMERALIEAFEREHPHIEVELIVPTGSYGETLTVWAIGDALPDVITLNRHSYSRFTGILQEIDTDRMPIDWEVYISPQLPDALIYKGRRLGLPKRMNTKVMVYDAEAFDQAGIEYPNESWTPEDYAYAARQLTRYEGDRLVRWGSGPLVIWNWFDAFNGTVYDEDVTEARLTSPEIIEATLFMTELHKEHAGWFDDFANFNEALAYGQVAMFADVGPWYIPDLLAYAAYDWQLAPLPGRPLEPEVTGMSISSTTENYDEALQFVTWVSTSDEAQRIIAEGTNLPVTRYGVETFINRAPGKGLETFFYMFDQDYEFPPIPDREVSGADPIIWNTFYDEILVGEVDPLTGLQRIQEQIQAMINEQFD